MMYAPALVLALFNGADFKLTIAQMLAGKN